MAIPLRALILEDRLADAVLMVRHLTRAGYDVTWERVDSEAGFLAKLESAWDIILSDYEMPQFDAPRALELLRLRGSDIPVIIISGTIGEDTAVGVMKLGASDYLLKDRLTRLGPAIAQALEKKQLQVDRRRVMEDLRQSEERFRQLAEAITEVFWMTDTGKHQMLYISPGYERIWGRPCESLYAAPQTWLESIHPEDRERIHHATATKQSAGTYDEEYRIIRPDQNVRWIHDRAFPISDATGAVYRIAGVAADITERKRLQDQFHEAQKLEAIGQLAGGVAHDFNNILTAILGFGELLLSQNNLPPATVTHIKEIQKAGYRASTLTRQLLAFGRRQLLAVKVIDLNATIVEIDALLRRLCGEQIDVLTQFQPSLGRVKVDPGQFEQVLVNLVVNARDAIGDHGRIIITTANVTLDDNYARQNPGVTAGPYVQLEVSDTGSGISDAVKGRLFEPFFTTKGVGRGTGLGLASCYGIVKQSGGHITVYSALGRGTTFKVYFPRVDAAVTPVTVSTPAPSQLNGTETILVVEDDRSIRKLCAAGLGSFGYDVVAAADGAEALKLFEADTAGKIHLVLTDMLMPRMNGMELLKQLRRTRPDLRVIFMSGYAEDMIKAQGVHEANVAFVEKPYTLPDLAKKIRESLDVPAAYSQPAPVASA